MFVYSGLYDVVEMRADYNEDNHRVYKFKLVKKYSSPWLALPRPVGHVPTAPMRAFEEDHTSMPGTLSSADDGAADAAGGASPPLEQQRQRQQQQQQQNCDSLCPEVEHPPSSLPPPPEHSGARYQVPTFLGSRKRKRKGFSHRIEDGVRKKYNGVMSVDISHGLEPFPIPALNSVDTCDWGKIAGFSYTDCMLPSPACHRKVRRLPVHCALRPWVPPSGSTLSIML